MSQYEAHPMRDPSLPFILLFTHRRSDRATNPSNWHENLEILYVTEGTGTVYCNEEQLSVGEGDVAILNANCLHTVSTSQEIQYACLIVDRSFCLANHFDTNRIHYQHLIRDPRLTEAMDHLLEEYRLPTETPFRTQGIRAAILQVLTVAGRHYSRKEDTPATDSRLLASIKQAMGYIRDQSDRDLSLEEVSELVGLSKYYFAREFHRITGYTFVAYVNLIRCEKAKHLLAKDQMSVASVGRSCGFPSASHFTRTFLHFTGCLPSAYRESGRAHTPENPHKSTKR